MSASSQCRLYLITPADIVPVAFADELAAALDAGDVGCLQLRLKELDDDAVRRAVDAVRSTVQDRDVALILNDRPDLAVETGCDGVHIGLTDASYADARRLVGPDAIVGVTCHASRHLAIVAAEEGADYVAFGAFFATATKHTTHVADVELLSWWHDTATVPCVAIGGITVDTCRPLVAAGADFLAVSSGIWRHPNGAPAAVREFNEILSRAG